MFQTIKNDFLPSIVVFLVAIPLCIGIALACGVSPVAGLLSGIIGGLVVGSLNGCPLMVSGPAAGLIAIVWDIIQSFGLQGLAVCISVAGVIQIIFGLMRVGVFFRAVSPAVIQGMLSGIGALIFFSQFHVMLDAKPQSSGFQNLILLPQAVFDLFGSQGGSQGLMAAMIGLITIAVIVGWSFVPQSLKQVPAVLVGVIVASIFAQVLSLEINFVKTPENLFVLPDLTDANFWNTLDYSGLLLASLGLAFIATTQALLTATATDKLHDGKKTDYNREVLAQGVGNLFSGVLGALPVTGVIVRSAANAQSGGKTRASAIMHAIWILTFILIFPGVLQRIPVCTLAAALVFTGIKLMNPKIAIGLAKHSRVEVFIYFTTTISIFTMGLLQGVLIGFVVALLQVIYKLNYCDVEVEEQESKIILNLKGNATFLALPKIADIMDNLKGGQEVHLQTDDLSFIDHAVIELLHHWESEYQKNGGTTHLQWDKIQTYTKPQLLKQLAT